MVNVKILANSGALTAFLLYMACVVLALISSPVLIWVFTTMFHGLTISTSFLEGSLNILNMLIGALLFSGISWVTFFTYGSIYNRLNK